MSDNHQLSITFADASPAQVNQWAAALGTFLEDTHPQIQTHQIRKDMETMDLGTTLGIFLGSGAAIAVAKGIQAWLTKNQDATLEVSTKDGKTIKATGLRSKDAASLVQTLLQDQSPD